MENHICQQYLNGNSISKISKSVGLCRSTVSKILRKNNIPTVEHYKSNRKYVIDESYFDQIDKVEKAYILGMIMADGNVWGNQIRLTLHENDSDTLYNIAKCLYKSDFRLYSRKDNKCKLIKITSSKLARSLINLGVTPNKSLTANLTINLHDALMPHFIRGVFDGDGCIYHAQRMINGRSYNQYSFSILGSEPIINLIHNFFMSYNIITKIRKIGNIYELRTSSKKIIIKIFNMFYDNQPICMERKFLKMKECLS